MMRKKHMRSLLESRATFLNLFRRIPSKRGQPGPDRDGFPQRYEILRKLGEGASGVVYQAWDRTIQRHLAIKVSRMQAGGVMDEARSAGRLRHPNIVGILDASMEGDLCYITMEYVGGPNLKEFCDGENLLPLKKVVEIALGVCSGLDHAHRMGVIHRDIKPSNIIMGVDGRPKITDFGIAHMVDKTVREGVFGTPDYMSPEQLRDEPVTTRSDIFSLGCVLYELIAGEKAFRGENCFTSIYKVIHEAPPPLSQVRPGAPRILERIIRKCLSKNPDQRYGTCAELAGDLRVALRGMEGGIREEKLGNLVDYVNRLPFFRGFPRERVEDLIAASNIVKVKPQSVILADGEISDTFHVLLRGRVKVRKDGQDIAFVEEGECFGEMACIAGQPRVAEVVADRECILMKIGAAVLDRASESVQLLFYRTFATTLVRRLSKSSQKIHPGEGEEQNLMEKAG